jgi:DNA-binding NarL/FixJ family response regulator
MVPVGADKRREMQARKTNLGLVVARPGLVRDGLQAVLSAIPEMDALEPADDRASALERLEEYRPDLVILDSSLPEGERCPALHQIKKRWPDVRCIAVADSPWQRRAMEDTGADTVLIEGFSAELLSTTIRALLAQPDEKGI